jgi:MtN3 and saliva related transmembrane protein
MDSIKVIGIVAAILSATSFVPQVLKAWRSHETADISLKMYLVTVSAFVLWTAYGIGLGDWVIIVSNSVSLVLSGTILAIKLKRG